MTGVLIERGNLDTNLHTRRMPCEHEDRDGVMILHAKESQRLPAN